VGLFVMPPPKVFDDPSKAGEYLQFSSYSHYNYLRPGLIPYVKRQRFEMALKMAQPYFGTGDAIDVGCADGVLLPSLAKYFKNAAGIDPHDGVLDTARIVVRDLPLPNVTLLNNRDMSFETVREKLGRTYRVAFVLETLEHVGSLPNLYQTKADFVEGVFSLLDADGIVIASVPRMVGPHFLAKHVIQRSLRIPSEKTPWKEVMRSAFFGDTSRLEPLWVGGHIGFNHLKLTKALRSRFDLKVSKGTLSSYFYVIGRKPATMPAT